MFNQTRDWLKHPTENLADVRHIDEFETVIMLVRATSKFIGKYRKGSKKMEEFIEWARARNYLS